MNAWTGVIASWFNHLVAVAAVGRLRLANARRRRGGRRARRDARLALRRGDYSFLRCDPPGCRISRPSGRHVTDDELIDRAEAVNDWNRQDWSTAVCLRYER